MMRRIWLGVVLWAALGAGAVGAGEMPQYLWPFGTSSVTEPASDHSDDTGELYVANVGSSTLSTINAHYTFVVDSDAAGSITLTVSPDRSLIINGRSDTALVSVHIMSGSTLDIRNAGGSRGQVVLDNAYSRLVNDGTMTVDGTISNSGKIVSGVGSVTTFGSDGEYLGETGSRLDNFGTMNLDGVIDNAGTIANNTGGTATVTGTINNSYALINVGTMTFDANTAYTGTISSGVENHSDGIMTLDGTINNSGYFSNVYQNTTMTFADTTIFTNAIATSALRNSGTMNLDGTVTNHGEIENRSGGTMTIAGTVYNQNLIANAGIMTVRGAIENNDTIANLNAGNLHFDAGTVYSGAGVVTNVTGGHISLASGMAGASLDALDGAIRQDDGDIFFAGNTAIGTDLDFAQVTGGMIWTGEVGQFAGLDAHGASLVIGYALPPGSAVGTVVFNGDVSSAGARFGYHVTTAVFNALLAGGLTVGDGETAVFTAAGSVIGTAGVTVTGTGRVELGTASNAFGANTQNVIITADEANAVARIIGTGNYANGDATFTKALGGTVEVAIADGIEASPVNFGDGTNALTTPGAKIYLLSDWLRLRGNVGVAGSAAADAVRIAAGKHVVFDASGGDSLTSSLTVDAGGSAYVEGGTLSMTGTGRDVTLQDGSRLIIDIGAGAVLKDVNKIIFGQDAALVVASTSPVFRRVVLDDVADGLYNADSSVYDIARLDRASLDVISRFWWMGRDLMVDNIARPGDTLDDYRYMLSFMGYNTDLMGDGYLDNVRSYNENKDTWGSGYNNFDLGSIPGIINDGYYRALTEGVRNGESFTVTLPNGRTATFAMSDGWNDAKNGGTIVHPVSIARQVTEILAGDVWKISLHNLQSLVALMDAYGVDCGSCYTVMDKAYLRNFWAGYVDIQQESGTYQGRDGYSYRARGVQVGYDTTRDTLLFGGAFSYLDGDYEDDIAVEHNSKIEHYNLSLYATYLFESGLFATGLGGYTYSDNSIRELRGNWTDEDYKTNTWYAGARLGYMWRRDGQLAFIPSVGLAYIDSRAGGHDIYTNGYATESMSSGGSSSLMVPLELRASYDINLEENGWLKLTANAGYTYYFNDDGPSSWITDLGHNAPVAVSSVNHRQGKSQWNIGAGVRYSVDRFDLDVNYDYYKRSQAEAHRLLANAGVHF